MKKKLFITISFLLLTRLCFSAPSNSISVPNSFNANTTISSSATNANNNEVQTKFNAHSHTDTTQTGTITSGTWQATDVGTAYGGTGNSYGLGLPSGAVFFMVAGSCPTGTTDVSTTYSNKFVMINATQGSTGGGATATESHTLTSAEMPSHTHTINRDTINAGAVQDFYAGQSNGGNNNQVTSGSTGSGGGHTHDITAAENRPEYVQMKACQID